MRSRLAAVVLLAAACGGSGARAGGALPEEARVDAALELAARLPRGAYRCAVARPGALSDRQRSTYLPISKGEPFAFLWGAPFVAVASAYATDRLGRVHPYTLIRTSADRQTVRRFLDTRSGMRLGWGDEPSDLPRAARYRARFLDDHTVAIGGDFPESRRVGAEARCLSLASRFPAAFEVAAWRGEEGLPRQLSGITPQRVDYRASSDERRVSMVHISTMRAPMDLYDVRVGELGPAFGVIPLSVLAESRDEHTDGRRLFQSTRVLWEDLMLAVEDERRIDVAAAEDARARGPQPADSIEIENLPLVREQRQLWQAQVDMPGPTGVRAREQLERLLVRAIDAHPGVAEFRAHLFELLARDIGDIERAEEVAARAIADGVGDTDSFRMLHREALARSDVERLAQALVQDGVVPRRQARDAAEGLARAVVEGVDYPFAEAAWIAGRALIARCYRAPAHPVPSIRVDLGATIEAIGALAEVADMGGAFWVALEGQRPPWGIARFSVDDAPRFALDVGRDVLIGAANIPGDPRLESLASSISASIAPGPVVLSFILVPLGGDVGRPPVWGRFEGTYDGERFTLSRIAGPGAHVDWARVQRYLIRPAGCFDRPGLSRPRPHHRTREPRGRRRHHRSVGRATLRPVRRAPGDRRMSGRTGSSRGAARLRGGARLRAADPPSSHARRSSVKRREPG